MLKGKEEKRRKKRRKIGEGSGKEGISKLCSGKMNETKRKDREKRNRKERKKGKQKKRRKKTLLFREFYSSLKTTTKRSFPSSSGQHLSFDHNLFNICKVSTKGVYFIFYQEEHNSQGRRYCGVWGGVTPPKILKNRGNSGKIRENSGKIMENSVTSGNICGC